MNYNGPLPSIRRLKKLAEWGGPFPMKGRTMMISAERFGFDIATIQFLQLFPDNGVFRNRDDFLCQCASLETTIRAGRLLKT
jgi:hypothetical protein